MSQTKTQPALGTSVPGKKKTNQQLRMDIQQQESKNAGEELRCQQLKNTAEDLRTTMKKVYTESEEDLKVEFERQKQLTRDIKSLEAAHKQANSKLNINAKMAEFWAEHC